MNDAFILSIDNLGRVAIPREIRKMINVKEGEKIEMGIDREKITFTKYSPMSTLREWGDCILSALSSVIEHDIILCDKERVIASNKKKYLTKALNSSALDVVYKREVVVKKVDDGSTMIDIFDDVNCEFCCELIAPIVKEEDLLGSIIVLATENKCFDDDVPKICKAFSNFITCVMK